MKAIKNHSILLSVSVLVPIYDKSKSFNNDAFIINYHDGDI